MKMLFFVAFIFTTITGKAQPYGNYFVAAKTGLSMREKPEIDSKVLDKIPYGTKVTTLEEPGNWVSVTTEGMMGYWRKVKYNNKTGYIVDNYLLPWTPPKLSSIKDLKQYLALASQPFGAKLVRRSGAMNQIEEGGWELSKQLYKNGSEWHQFLAYEYNSDTYFLPDFSLQQGFLLLRLIPEFKMVFGEKDEFPTANKKITRDDNDYEIKLFKTVDEQEYGGPFTIEKIKIEFTDGATYIFEMYMQDNQLVIFFGGGL
ncbi:MAG TPA: SH3 domain-containing protein [Chitinophagaceae bacterium]|nr:SH3 domain-containing protein [Chitinophagaceae bacterium]